ncbi:MBL fold metallo-hydrolase [Derxia lacustris]|uniref:MBL fold metallo-hydrolase n=1 Tax=Derxia lacustris TaxID=764842 RepID=UPI000A170D06|nr:MBL fold metallo-hydrolase [Derxia lacustris]
MNCSIISVTAFQQNCSLIWDDTTKLGALVDAGGEADRLLDIARQKGITIEKLLVTHGHLDHCGAVAELADKLGVPVEGPHRGDDFWIDGLADSAKKWGFPPSRSFVPTRWLEDGDTVTVGSIELDVVHCPGHTPGHVVFLFKPGKLAWVGDVLFKGSIGRTDFPRGNHDDLIHSIRAKLFPLGDDIRFVPGHGPMSTFGAERADNPFVADENFG